MNNENVEPVHKLKLSEAILKGCEAGGQIFFAMGDSKGRTCALGAAYQGTFNENPMKQYRSNPSFSARMKLVDVYPELKTPITIHSEISKELPPLVFDILKTYPHALWTLEEVIIKINDRAKMTREEVAVILEKAGY
jgi:hypothetical protein